MRIELVSEDGCPSGGKVLERLRTAMGLLGLDGGPEVVSPREARGRHGWWWPSPTILVDGRDILSPATNPGGPG